MKKKIAIGAGIALLVIAVVMVGLKTTLGDKITELPGEEHAEKVLHLQESNTTNNTTITPTEPGESGSTESSESGP